MRVLKVCCIVGLLTMAGLAGGSHSAFAQGAVRTTQSTHTTTWSHGAGAGRAPVQLTPAQQNVLQTRNRLGYLPRDLTAYAQTKQLANRLAGETAPAAPATAGGTDPVSGPGWTGRTCSAGCTPDDSNGAIGTARYVEIVNQELGIYDRSGTDLMGANADHSLQTLTGDKDGLSDPVIFWDPASYRFFFEVLDTGPASGSSPTTYDTEWGFSKSSSPSSFADWCTYDTNFGYGSAGILPDYPKFGQTTDFLLIGVNAYGTVANGSDLDWISKPQVGTGTVSACPDPHTLTDGQLTTLQDASNSPVWTPVPAIQTDPSGTGYVVGSYDVGGYQGDIVGQLPQANYLTVFSVTKGANGSPVLSAPASVTVNTYQSPADALQDAWPTVIDTLDGRLNHAVSAVDPLHGSKPVVWTDQAVFGGAGAEERWYEIDPSAAALVQHGVETSSSVFAFNGAISPDRAVNGSTTQFGGTMFMTFTTSGTSTFPTVNMVDKYGDNPESAWVTVKASPGPDDDFSCNPGNAIGIGVPPAGKCRWGDYSGATPDPTPNVPAGASIGSVWMTNEYVVGDTNPADVTNSTGPGGITELTWNFQGLPASQPVANAPEAPWLPLVPLSGLLGAAALMVRRGRPS